MSDEVKESQKPAVDGIQDPADQTGPAAQDQSPAGGDQEAMDRKNKELLSELKKAKAKNKVFEDEIDNQKTKSLEEKEEYKTLYDKEKTANVDKADKLTKLIKLSRLELVGKDMNDPGDIVNHMSEFEFDEETLKITNADEALKKLKEKKPYLFKSEETTPVGVSHGNPNLSQSKDDIDVEAYKKNPAAIDAAFEKRMQIK